MNYEQNRLNQDTESWQVIEILRELQHEEKGYKSFAASRIKEFPAQAFC